MRKEIKTIQFANEEYVYKSNELLLKYVQTVVDYYRFSIDFDIQVKVVNPLEINNFEILMVNKICQSETLIFHVKQLELRNFGEVCIKTNASWKVIASLLNNLKHYHDKIYIDHNDNYSEDELAFISELEKENAQYFELGYNCKLEN